MRTLTLILLLCGALFAQDTSTVQYIDSILHRPKTLILLREDGTTWGEFTVIPIGQDTLYAIVGDTTLVQSRIAHDDAIAKARREGLNEAQKIQPGSVQSQLEELKRWVSDSLRRK